MKSENLTARQTTSDRTLETELALSLAALGYPAFSHIRRESLRQSPREVLFTALATDNLDIRLIEALPWLILTFPDVLNPDLLGRIVAKNLQNRLGYLVNLAEQLANKKGTTEKAKQIASARSELKELRLPTEDTLCHSSLTEVEKRWLRLHRPPEAEMWNLLTDLRIEHLSYAKERTC